MFRVKKNDQVIILAGRDRGKRGRVLEIFPSRNRLKVEGLNLVKKHLRRSQMNPQGSILSREAPLPTDRVALVCPRCNRGVRVGFQVSSDGIKSRICRRCQESL